MRTHFLSPPLTQKPGGALILPHGPVASILGVRCDGPGGAPRLWVMSEGGAEAAAGLQAAGGLRGGVGDAAAADADAADAALATPLGGGYWDVSPAVQVRRAARAAAAAGVAAAAAAAAAAAVSRKKAPARPPSQRRAVQG